MIELIEEVYNNLTTINNLLFIKQILKDPNLPEPFIKKLVHSCVRNINQNHPGKLFLINLREYREVIKPVSQYTLKKILESSTQDSYITNEQGAPSYKKLTVVTVVPNLVDPGAQRP